MIAFWGDEAQARHFFRWLLDDTIPECPVLEEVDPKQVASWAIQYDLGSLLYSRCQQSHPTLTPFLQGDRFAAIAENKLHFDALHDIETAFTNANLSLTLLKGMALAQSVYGDSSWRTMSDIDILVQDSEMKTAVFIMQELGYNPSEKESRPASLQALGQGEIPLNKAGTPFLIELHWTALHGWWLQRTTNIDNDDIWQRRQPLTETTWQLSPEDTILNIAVHLTVNHQLGMSVVRGLVDVAMVAKTQTVSWQLVAERAIEWRVQTAVYTILNLLHNLIAPDGMEEALAQLRPFPLRQRLLRPYANLQAMLSGQNVRNGRLRYFLLLLLVDRHRDMIKLIYRTIWPEQSWLHARYGKSVTGFYHLKQLIQHGNI